MAVIYELLEKTGVGSDIAGCLYKGIVIFLIILLCVIIEIIENKFVLKTLARFILKNKFKWDNIFLERKVFQNLSHVIPAIMIYSSAPIFGSFEGAIQKTAVTAILILSMIILNAVLNSVDDIYKTYPISKTRPIKGLLQVVKIIFYIIIGIVIIANLINKSPLVMLSGVGALTAILSLVFKDTILGFVAGIQLTSNDMLRIGDWIEMSKYGADGTVIDISLITVKVQNFDKTIVTIPTYYLVSDSFRNWRGMQELGARRFKRSINIDISTIGFCTEEMIEKFKKVHYLKEYILERQKEIDQHNEFHKFDTSLVINGRRLTNIGVFRNYIQNYLKNHPLIQQEMIQIVRQLSPDENGLPLEIYVFINVIDWVEFEKAQADIFDHMLAVVSEFGLRVFQNPTGYDIRQISDAQKEIYNGEHKTTLS